MSKELKPCPFCGGDASLIVKTFFGLPEEDVYTVACNDCNSRSRYSDDRKETVKVWNTRHAEEISRYRRALHNLKEDCTLRKHFAVSDEEKLFLAETISHIETELDFNPDTAKGGEDE